MFLLPQISFQIWMICQTEISLDKYWQILTLPVESAETIRRPLVPLKLKFHEYDRFGASGTVAR